MDAERRLRFGEIDENTPSLIVYDFYKRKTISRSALILKKKRTTKTNNNSSRVWTGRRDIGFDL